MYVCVNFGVNFNLFNDRIKHILLGKNMWWCTILIIKNASKSFIPVRGRVPLLMDFQDLIFLAELTIWH